MRWRSKTDSRRSVKTVIIFHCHSTCVCAGVSVCLYVYVFLVCAVRLWICFFYGIVVQQKREAHVCRLYRAAQVYYSPDSAGRTQLRAYELWQTHLSHFVMWCGSVVRASAYQCVSNSMWVYVLCAFSVTNTPKMSNVLRYRIGWKSLLLHCDCCDRTERSSNIITLVLRSPICVSSKIRFWCCSCMCCESQPQDSFRISSNSRTSAKRAMPMYEYRVNWLRKKNTTQ